MPLLDHYPKLEVCFGPEPPQWVNVVGGDDYIGKGSCLFFSDVYNHILYGKITKVVRNGEAVLLHSTLEWGTHLARDEQQIYEWLVPLLAEPLERHIFPGFLYPPRDFGLTVRLQELENVTDVNTLAHRLVAILVEYGVDLEEFVAERTRYHRRAEFCTRWDQYLDENRRQGRNNFGMMEWTTGTNYPIPFQTTNIMPMDTHTVHTTTANTFMLTATTAGNGV